jgi:AcrR family transcriptional regulator
MWVDYTDHVPVPARQRLLDALVNLTASQGLDGVSIREVAAAAGVSIGTVQYHCHNKDQMLVSAPISTPDEKIGSRLNRALLELLPLDEVRRTESRVYLAFAARAAVVPSLAKVQHTFLTELRDQCAAALQAARKAGETRSDVDPDQAAAGIAALVDGLLVHLLTDPTGLPEEEAVDVLRAHLSTLLVL